VKPVKDRRLLEMVFTFPDLRPHFRSRPGHVIAHIIGYEGAGSLLSYLKATKHWVDALSVGPTHVNAGTELFKVSMALTKEGLGIVHCILKSLIRQGNYDEIIAIVFKYIDLLKERTIESCKKHLTLSRTRRKSAHGLGGA
jgi:insulysin